VNKTWLFAIAPASVQCRLQLVPRSGTAGAASPRARVAVSCGQYQCVPMATVGEGVTEDHGGWCRYWCVQVIYNHQGCPVTMLFSPPEGCLSVSNPNASRQTLSRRKTSMNGAWRTSQCKARVAPIKSRRALGRGCASAVTASRRCLLAAWLPGCMQGAGWS
jgi:hypothetical protein